MYEVLHYDDSCLGGNLDLGLCENVLLLRNDICGILFVKKKTKIFGYCLEWVVYYIYRSGRGFDCLLTMLFAAACALINMKLVFMLWFLISLFCLFFNISSRRRHKLTLKVTMKSSRFTIPSNCQWVGMGSLYPTGYTSFMVSVRYFPLLIVIISCKIWDSCGLMFSMKSYAYTLSSIKKIFLKFISIFWMVKGDRQEMNVSHVTYSLSSGLDAIVLHRQWDTEDQLVLYLCLGSLWFVKLLFLLWNKRLLSAFNFLRFFLAHEMVILFLFSPLSLYH